MSYRLVKNTWLQVVQKCLFILYNAAYVMYKFDVLGNNLQLFLLFIFIIFNVLVWVFSDLRWSRIKWAYPFKNGIIIIGVTVLISFIIQIYHNDFQNYLILSSLSFFTPILTAFILVNTVRKNDYNFYINILLIKTLIIFFVENASNFSLSNLMQISWSNSFSPFESSMAHEFLLLECVYLSLNKKKTAFISMVFCMLSMKRISFLMAPFLFLVANRINKIEIKFSTLKLWTIFLKAITFLSPFVIIFFYREQTSIFLMNVFDFDLNGFMSGRLAIYKLLINNIPYFNGFGSVNSWLLQFSYTYFGTTWNGILHNDVLRIYYELTFVGFIIFFNGFINIFKKNIWTIIMGTYLLFVIITSHLFDYYPVWLIYYFGCSIIYSSNDIVKKE